MIEFDWPPELTANYITMDRSGWWYAWYGDEPPVASSVDHEWLSESDGTVLRMTENSPFKDVSGRSVVFKSPKLPDGVDWTQTLLRRSGDVKDASQGDDVDDGNQKPAVQIVEWKRWPKALTADYLSLDADSDGEWDAFWGYKPQCDSNGEWLVPWGDLPDGFNWSSFTAGDKASDITSGVEFMFNPPDLDVEGPVLIANPHKAKAKQPVSDSSVSSSEKGTFMSTVNQLKIANTNAALAAAKSRAGKLVMKRIVKFAKPKMPAGYKEFADSPLFQVLAANLFAAAIINYLPTDARARFASEALLEAAAGNLIDDLAIAEFLDGLLDGVSVPAVKEQG